MVKVKAASLPARLLESAPYIAAATALSVAALFAGKASAQSFDCGLADSRSELAICNSEELLVLDENLSAMVSRRLTLTRNMPDRQAFAREQLEWTLQRERCDTDRDCLAQHYRDRMAAIAGVDGLAALADVVRAQP